jgi:CO/xanthine dehydrogenase Mo-binding subunit
MILLKKNYRVDAADKLRGKTKYIRDEKIPGLWHGATIRSPYPRARILNISFDPSFDWKSVVTITAKDIKNNFVAMIEQDMPFIAEGIVNYVGEPVVLLAAADHSILNYAVNHVRVEYEQLPYVQDMMFSERSTVGIYGRNNVFKEILICKGDLEKAAQQAFTSVEIEGDTGFQEHLYLEPNGLVAIPDGNHITIKGSMQCPYYIKNALDLMFRNEVRITVIQSPTGGAFGGKEDFPSLLAGHAALLAVKCGHPVAMFYDREEDVQFTTKRHPSHYRHKAWVDRDGHLLGLDLNLWLDGGAYSTLSPVVLSRAALTAANTYYIPNIRIAAKALATNTVPSGAFRGFGGPQAVFAIEMLMEKIAMEMQIPAHKVRRRNLIGLNQVTATGQKLRYSVSAKECFEDALKESRYEQKFQEFKAHNALILERLRTGRFPKHDKNDLLKGIGISSSIHGAGFTGVGENKIHGKIRVEINDQGCPVIYTAQTEMGQGKDTAFRNMLADALQISYEQVLMAEVNTDLVPNSGPTVASRSTMVIGSLLVEAAADLIAALSSHLQKEHSREFSYQNGRFSNHNLQIDFSKAAQKYPGLSVEKQYSHPPFIQFDDVNYTGDAYPVFSYAAAVADIEVDPVTFEVIVRHFYTTHEIGKAINPDQAAAQIEGGSLQGIGYALYEKIELRDARFDITGFTDYIIPTTADAPQMHVKILENPYPHGPFGAKGLGELPLVGAAPAVISALWMIFGKEFNSIPLTPEKLAGIASEGAQT